MTEHTESRWDNFNLNFQLAELAANLERLGVASRNLVWRLSEIPFPKLTDRTKSSMVDLFRLIQHVPNFGEAHHRLWKQTDDSADSHLKSGECHFRAWKTSQSL